MQIAQLCSTFRYLRLQPAQQTSRLVPLIDIKHRQGARPCLLCSSPAASPAASLQHCCTGLSTHRNATPHIAQPCGLFSTPAVLSPAAVPPRRSEPSSCAEQPHLHHWTLDTCSDACSTRLINLCSSCKCSPAPSALDPAAGPAVLLLRLRPLTPPLALSSTGQCMPALRR